jgi:hypothetical protein
MGGGTARRLWSVEAAAERERIEKRWEKSGWWAAKRER